MSSLAQQLEARNLPPETGGERQVVSTATAAAATSYDWITALGASAPKGQVFITIEAIGFDVYVRFGAAATTGTTANNGLVVRAGTKERWYVHPARHRFIDHLATGVGVLKLQVLSLIHI